MGSSSGDTGIAIGNPGFLRWFCNYYHYYGDEPVNKQQKKSLTMLSAAGLALALGAPGAMAGVVDNINNSSPLGACGAANAADTVACVGAWNLSNVQVDLIRLVDGSTFGAFDADPASSNYGTYTQMVVGDSFVSKVYSDSAKNTLMAKVAGKVWPVGEPTAIKAVNGDTAVQNGKPANCLINTSYLDSTETGDVNAAYLDTANPQPVICSSGFQTHKRFKVAMQPATTTGVSSGDGHPIDLVFNTTDNATITPYEVFSKINNYTDKRLSGYKIEVGVGTGAGFKTATDLDISGQLYLSLGIGEGTTGNSTPPTYSDMFDPDGLATFSHGLFGAISLPHFPSEGFFSNTTAYYPVSAQCSTAAGVTVTCPNTRVVGTGATVDDSDTIFSSGPLSTNYTNLFGAWLPSIWEPKGIFFDFDSNPSTDPKLVAWWNGTQWLKGQADNFAPVSQTELNAWASDSRYSIDVIEDVLNLGINYIVDVGDINNPQGTKGFTGSTNFTVRIIPVVAADQTVPAWVGTTPTPLVPPSSGGGCTIGGDGHFDPTFPALLLAGLGFFGLRRFSRKS